MSRLPAVLLRRVLFPAGRILIGVIVGFLVLGHFYLPAKVSRILLWSAIAHRHVHDRAGLIPLQDFLRFNEELVLVQDETGIPIEVLTIRLTRGESLERFAAAEASRRHLGARSGDRALLLVYDASSKRLRAELGYGLEGYFSDAFIGRLVADHAALFFESGQATMGIHLMVRILHDRIRDQMLGGTFDPTPFDRPDASGYVSGGAGASAPAPFQHDGTRVFRAAGAMTRLSTDERRRFTAQPTVQDAHAAYVEWLRAGIFDPDVDLFTPASKYFLAAWPGMSRPYMDFLLASVWGKAYTVVERGTFAMLYFTDTPLLSPEFFQRDSTGWRRDIDAEAFSTEEYVGGAYTWCMTDNGYPPQVFRDQFVLLAGVCVRVRDGDNRMLRRPRGVNAR